MQKLIIQLLLRYKVLQVITLKNTFFKTSLLAKKVKLSPELIRLNYEKLSPIKNPAILSYKDKDLLYLWFFNKDASQSLLYSIKLYAQKRMASIFLRPPLNRFMSSKEKN